MSLTNRNPHRTRVPEGKRPRAARLVVVAPSWIGDAVMSLPLVGLLSSSADVRLTVAVRGAVGRVYWGAGGVTDVVSVPGGGRVRRIGGLAALVRATRADGALVLPPSFSSALGCFLGGAKRRVGFCSDARRFLLSASLDPKPLRDEHLSENYLRLGRLILEQLRIPGNRRFDTPKPTVFDSERAAVTKRLERAGDSSGRYAVVVPGAAYGPAKSWPAAKYKELVRLLAEETFVVLGGTGAERDLCGFVGNGAARTANLAGETTLGEFMALLERAEVVIANDSGAPHLAASLGVPVVTIFGSTSPRWTAPLGDDVHVVYDPVRCSPCFRTHCPTGLECFEAIPVERVFDAVRSAAGGKRGRERGETRVEKGVEKRGLS